MSLNLTTAVTRCARFPRARILSVNFVLALAGLHRAPVLAVDVELDARDLAARHGHGQLPRDAAARRAHARGPADDGLTEGAADDGLPQGNPRRLGLGRPGVGDRAGHFLGKRDRSVALRRARLLETADLLLVDGVRAGVHRDRGPRTLEPGNWAELGLVAMTDIWKSDGFAVLPSLLTTCFTTVIRGAMSSLVIVHVFASPSVDRDVATSAVTVAAERLGVARRATGLAHRRSRPRRPVYVSPLLSPGCGLPFTSLAPSFRCSVPVTRLGGAAVVVDHVLLDDLHRSAQHRRW